MSEPRRYRRSVFGKLLAIMLTMTLSLLILMSLFLAFGFFPVLNRAMGRVIGDDVRRIAATQPDYAAAKRMAKELDLEIRYEGPDGAWTTARWVPSIADARRHPEWGRARLERAPNGGTYLFYWIWERRTIDAHHWLFAGFILLIIATIVVAHLVIRRLLLPLRTLGDGVARLSAGELEVQLPEATRDEFGTLTNAFNEMVSRVRAMVRSRDQLLLDVSHELRSPLTRMRVAVELLPEGANRENMVADIAEMETMIAELLELERLRGGIRMTRIDLAPILRDSVAGFARAAIIAMPPEIIVEADAEKLRTVLRNLLDNATKYSTGTIEVSAAIDERNVVVQVSDDGPGIPPSALATIFEPFYRVSRSRSKTTPGYGLGLSICKHVIEAHGGTIEARNRAGGGAEMVFTLSRAKDPQSGGASTPGE